MSKIDAEFGEFVSKFAKTHRSSVYFAKCNQPSTSFTSRYSTNLIDNGLLKYKFLIIFQTQMFYEIFIRKLIVKNLTEDIP